MNDPDAGTAGGTASFLAARSDGKRADLAPGPHAVYQAVLRGFASTGRPPEPTELQETARVTVSPPARPWPAYPPPTFSASTVRAASGWPTRTQTFGALLSDGT